MKTSKKLLIFTAGILIAFFITGLMFFRSEVNTLMAKAQLELPYDLVEAGEFYNLDFSSNWIVHIRQGRQHALEIAKEGSIDPIVENIHGTLYLKYDTLTPQEGQLYARISVPDLERISATGNTQIEIRNFQSDSLTVVLEDRGKFISNKNTIKHVSYKTSGEASIEIIDNM